MVDLNPSVPRIEDLPYMTSPPIEFTYRSTAIVSAGAYTWADAPSVLTPNRPLMENMLYYFRSISLSADIEEFDYMANISTIPTFQTYLKSGARAILFREPIYMLRFFEQFEYRLTWITRRASDQLYAAFSGVLAQGGNLVGKNSVTLVAVISAQEIGDEKFVSKFEKGYPGGGN